jgi:chromosome partitioning protein
VVKTTTTLNLATALSAVGKTNLIIDFDPQGNATTGLGITEKKNILGSYEALIGQILPSEAIQATSIPHLSLMPASPHLSGAEVELVGMVSRERLLMNALENLDTSFDYIFIDCPPSLGLLTLNALVAANTVLVPLQCEFYAMEGLSQLLYTIGQVRKKFNPCLNLQGIVLTMFDNRSSLSAQVANDVRYHLKEKVYKTHIPRNVRVAEAPSFGKPAILYDLKCHGSQAYIQLAKEILYQEGDLAA